MNSVVLIVAGVLIAVGIALIVLSVMLARRQASQDEPLAEPPAPEQAESAAFIDQPLQTDMATELGPKPSADGETAPLEEAGVEPSQDEAPSPTAADDPTEETAAVTATPVPAVELDGRASLLQVSHDFRVQLASKYLENSLFDEAVVEYEKAVAVTSDPGSKLHLYVEIGNVRRAQRRYGEARSAYNQAAEHAHDHALLDHLHRTSEEMRGLEAHDDTGGSARPGKED